MDLQHYVPKQNKTLGHSRQDKWTEKGRRGNSREWEVNVFFSLKMKVKKKQRKKRGERNGDEGRDDNWASFASVSVCLTDTSCFNLGQGYVGSS